MEILTRIVGSTDAFPQALLYLGRSYHALGEYSRAAQALNFHLRRHPGSMAGHFFLGRTYLALGDYPGAIRHLRIAVEKDPRFSAAQGLLGLAYVKARRPEKAIFCFASSLETDPQNKRLQVGYLNTALVLAIRLFYRGELVDSARLFTEVLDQRPESILPHLYLAAIYRELGRHNLALLHMDAASRMSPQDPFLHLQKALIFLAQGQPKAAAEEIRIGTGLLKGSVSPGRKPEEILRFITLNLLGEKRYRETVFYGTRLLKTSYDDPQMHAIVAEAYRGLGELQKARNHFARALENDKGSLEIRYGLLAVLWESGDYGELLAESSRILARSAGDVLGSYFRSLALSRTGAPAEQVLAALQAQLKARGPDPLMMSELGAAYARAGLPELAEPWLLRALKRGHEEPDTILALVSVYEALGRKADQREGLRRYLALHPGDREARRRLVRIHLELEAWNDAAEEIARILPFEPGNAKLKTTLAYCYRRSGRFAEALILIRDLLAVSPGSEDLMKAAVYCLDRMGVRTTAVRAIESFVKENGESLSLSLMLGVLLFQDGALEKSAAVFRRAVSAFPRDWRAHRNLGMVYRKLGSADFAERFLAKAEELRKSAQATGRLAE